MIARWAAPVEGIGEKVDALIATGKVPATISVAAVEAAAARYQAFEPIEAGLAPSEAMDAADALIDRMIAMQSDLQTLPIEVCDAVALARARRGANAPDPILDAVKALGAAWGLLELARREIEAAPKRNGAPAAKHTPLILDLAAIIEKAGGKVDASKSGPLSSLIVIIPEFRDADPKQLNGFIRRALSKRDQA